MKKEGFIETEDGRQFFYTEYENESAPAVGIFIHGGSSTGQRSFGRLAESLNKAFRCITYDKRGHGRSQADGKVTIEKLTDDLRELILKMNLHNVILAGHSLGGLVVYSYFEKYKGDRIKGTAVFDMSPKVLNCSGWKYGLRMSKSPFLAGFETNVQKMTCCLMREAGGEIKEWAELAGWLTPCPYSSALHLLWLDMLDSDYRSAAYGITVPMIYFFTEHGMYPPSVAEWLKENVAGKVICVDMHPHNHFDMTEAVDMIEPEFLNVYL